MIVDLVAQVGDEGEQVAPALGVERADRLVEDQQARLRDEGLGDPEPLPHPARVARDPAAGGIGQADLLEDGRSPGARASRAPESLEPARQLDELTTGHPAVVARVLVQDADGLPGTRIARVDDGTPSTVAEPAVGVARPVMRRRVVVLPGPIGSEQPEHGTRRDLQVEAIDGQHARVAAEPLRQRVRSDRDAAHRSSRPTAR